MNTSRVVSVGVCIALALALVASATGCAPARRPVASAPPNVSTTRAAIAAAADAVAAMPAAEPALVTRAVHPRTIAEDDATRVFRAMHPQLVACYTRRLASHPSARAYLVVDVIVGADGRPRDVSTTGGGLLGRETVDCMTRHVRSAIFAPPDTGGTARVRVPFTFRPDASEDEG